MIVAVWIAAFLLNVVLATDLVPLILLSGGVWTVVVAGFRAAGRKDDGAFSTFGWGMLFIVLGGSLYMVKTGMDPVYIVVFVLILVGALAIATAVRPSRK